MVGLPKKHHARVLLPLGCALALFCSFEEAAAGDLSREYLSAPLLGSGGAGMTDVMGIDALFYNPANLARTPGVLGDVVLVSPQIEASDNGLKIYKDVKANKNMLDVVGGLVGKPVSVALQNATGASFRRAGLAVIQRADLRLGIRNDPISGLPTVLVYSSARAGAAFGIGRSFASDQFHFGITGLVIQKAETRLDASALEAQSKFKNTGGQSLLSELMKRGVGVGAHAAIMFTPRANSSPEFAVVARNLGLDYSVGGKSSSQRPAAELQTIDVGFSMQPGTKNSRARISLDVYDVMNKSQENIYKRLHLGTEVTFSSVLGVQGGLNQGYTTYGMFLNTKVIRLDAGIFAEELGKYPGDSKSRNYYGRLTVGWSK